MDLRRDPPTAVLLLLFLPALGAAAQGELGNVCVQDYVAGATCTANDVRIESVEIVELIEGCDWGVFGEMLATLRIQISSLGSPDRYDIGIFIALDGGEALSGDSCYHTFLSGPLTPFPIYGDLDTDVVPDLIDGPWWDGDADLCGDMEASTEIFFTTEPLRIRCVDTDFDGQADASLATSWAINTATVCSGVTDAFPATNARCRYDGQRFNFAGVAPVAVGEDPFADANGLRIRPGFPNPFGHSTEFEFRLPETGELSLRIHDARGRHVRKLAAQRMDAGLQRIVWDGRDDAGGLLPAGIYYYELRVAGRSRSGKLTLLR